MERYLAPDFAPSAQQKKKREKTNSLKNLFVRCSFNKSLCLVGQRMTINSGWRSRLWRAYSFQTGQYSLFQLQSAAPDIVMTARMNGEEVAIEDRAQEKANETSAIGRTATAAPRCWPERAAKRERSTAKLRDRDEICEYEDGKGRRGTGGRPNKGASKCNGGTRQKSKGEKGWKRDNVRDSVRREEKERGW